MAVSEGSYNTMGCLPARFRGNSAEGSHAGVARWRVAAARGEIQRAAAVTMATWQRARRAVIELLYDNRAEGHAAGQHHHQ